MLNRTNTKSFDSFISKSVSNSSEAFPVCNDISNLMIHSGYSCLENEI